MSFEHPLYLCMLLLAPLDLALALRREAKRRPSLLALLPPLRRKDLMRRRLVVTRLSAIAGALFIIAASISLAGPAWGTRSELVQREGLEIAIVLDVSRSMLAEDMTPAAPGASASRLAAALSFARLALTSAPGATFSLVAVKGEGVLLVPMSDDLDALNSGLDWAGPGLMTKSGTDIGSGIETALGSFSPLADRGKVILLLSDGGDLAGNARAAALDARQQGARLFIVGFGGAVPAAIPLGDGTFVEDSRGGRVLVPQNLRELKDLALASGGTYVDASDSSALSVLSQEIAKEGKGGYRLEERSRNRGALFAKLALLALILKFGSSFFLNGRRAASRFEGQAGGRPA